MSQVTCLVGWSGRKGRSGVTALGAARVEMQRPLHVQPDWESGPSVQQHRGSCPLTDLVSSCVQDEFSPNSVVLRTAVIKQRVGKVGHAFVTESVPAAEEHSILQKWRKKEGHKRTGRRSGG